jgi:hypothetical protein
MSRRYSVERRVTRQGFVTNDESGVAIICTFRK